MDIRELVKKIKIREKQLSNRLEDIRKNPIPNADNQLIENELMGRLFEIKLIQLMIEELEEDF